MESSMAKSVCTIFPPYFSCPGKRRYASKRRTLDSSKEIQECEEHKLLTQSSRFNLILRSIAGRRSATRVTIGANESSVMPYESPPAETRRCESCLEEAISKFFLDWTQPNAALASNNGFPLRSRNQKPFFKGMKTTQTRHGPTG